MRPGNGSTSGNSNNGADECEALFGTAPLGMNGKDRVNGRPTGLGSNA